MNESTTSSAGLVEAASTAGEYLIQAAAVIGRLSTTKQMILDAATGGAALRALGEALAGMATVSPSLQESLRTHPPAGFAGTLHAPNLESPATAKPDRRGARLR